MDKCDAFAKIAAMDERLNMLVFVLDFEYLNTVIVDDRKYLKFLIFFRGFSFFFNEIIFILPAIGLSDPVKDLLQIYFKNGSSDVAFAFVQKNDARY